MMASSAASEAATTTGRQRRAFIETSKSVRHISTANRHAMSAMAASRNRVARGCGPKSAHDCGQLQARCQASTASTRASSGQARSRSETVTSSIGHGIASPGSSQRMPCSYSGAYSSVVL